MGTDYHDTAIAERYASGVVGEDLCLKPVLFDIADRTLSGIEHPLVYDLGCGPGKYSIEFAHRGSHVLAVDSSEEMIRIAQERNAHEDIEYRVADGSALSVPSIYDFVLMNMIIPEAPSESSLREFFQRASNALKLNGTFVCSALHPLYLVNRDDTLDKATSFDRRRYFDEGHTFPARAVAKNGETMEFTENHYSLDCISRNLAAAGLVVHRLHESLPIPQQGVHLPLYLVFETGLAPVQ